jgi:hypothetical protein
MPKRAIRQSLFMKRKVSPSIGAATAIAAARGRSSPQSCANFVQAEARPGCSRVR